MYKKLYGIISVVFILLVLLTSQLLLGNLILIFYSGFYGLGLLFVAIIIGACGLIESKTIRAALFWIIFVIGAILYIQAFIFVLVRSLQI